MESGGRLIGTVSSSISIKKREITMTDYFRNYSERGRNKGPREKRAGFILM